MWLFKLGVVVGSGRGGGGFKHTHLMDVLASQYICSPSPHLNTQSACISSVAFTASLHGCYFEVSAVYVTRRSIRLVQQQQ